LSLSALSSFGGNRRLDGCYRENPVALAKRLARGRFDWPGEIDGIAKVVISATQFAALMMA
jgi:hypothetical protein